MPKVAKSDPKDPRQYVLDRFDPDGTQAERVAFEQQWLTSIGLFIGAPFVQDGRLIRQPTSIKQQSSTYNANLILPKVMRFCAKLGSVNPTVKVLPNTDRWSDLQAAKAAEMFYEHARYVTRFKEKRARALLTAAIYGSGFLKICWRPDKGASDRIYIDRAGRPNPMVQFDASLRSQYERAGMFRDVAPGEIDGEVIEPWNFWWDPNARGGGIADCRWVSVVSARDVDEIYNETGVRVEPENNVVRGAEMYREIIAFLAAGQSGVAPMAMRPRVSRTAREIAFFSRPDRDYPMGRYIRLVNDQVIDDRDNPYTASGSPLPFVKYDCYPVEGRFIGISMVELLRQPQKAYNQSRGHMMNMQRTSGYAPVFLQKGSGVKASQVKGIHAQIFEYAIGSVPPQFGQPPSLPAYIGDNAMISKGEMNEISAQTDPANSKLPGQLRSGSAISAVQADSNLILSPTVEKMMSSDEDAGVMMLQLIGMMYDEPRLVTIMGPSGEIDPRYMKGADMRRNYRLRVIAQPGELESAESRTANMLDALQLGALNPQDPEHQILLLRGLKFHSGDDVVNALLVQTNAEEREIEKIIDSQGQYQDDIFPWFDITQRTKILERRMSSREFDIYPEQTKAALVDRWKRYASLIEERAKKQLEAMALANGAPATPGKASQPSR